MPPSTTAEALNVAIMSTFVGLIAGLTVNALIVVARDISSWRSIFKPEVMFGVGIAALFATSAFGRANTHFAKGGRYTWELLVLDVFTVVFGSALVGLLSRELLEEQHRNRLWLWLALLAISLLGRVLILTFRQHIPGLVTGMVALSIGLLLVVVVWWRWSSSDRVMRLVSLFMLAAVIFQFFNENGKSLLKLSELSERAGRSSQPAANP